MKNPVGFFIIIFLLFACKPECTQLLSDLKQANK